MIKLDNACLNKYHAAQSKHRIAFELNRLAKLLNLDSVNSIDWENFSRNSVVMLLNCPELKKRKSTTQNFTLNVIKSLSEEAWHAQLISEKQYTAIAKIPQFRGEYKRSPSCLTNTEIKQILLSCVAEGSVKGGVGREIWT